MTDYVVTLGEKQTFGTGDSVTCYIDVARVDGIQIEAEGFDLADATVEVMGLRSGDFAEVEPDTAATSLALVGEGFRLGAARISGLSGAGLTVTFV